MKLLYDENLALRLTSTLEDVYPDSQHVRELGMASAPDREIWDFAGENGFVLVSKDSDFQQLTFLHGFPPKVVWIRKGNASVEEIEELLRSSLEVIREFEASQDAAYLILS